MPDLGLKSVFSTAVKGEPRFFEGVKPRDGDEVESAGDIPIHTWSDLLNVPFRLTEELGQPSLPTWAKQETINGESMTLVRVAFYRPSTGERFSTWCQLGKLPWEEMAPSLLWFVLKLCLFTVGALVLWRRPNDDAAALFFLLCVVTLGAYMGGYHWARIATQWGLLIVFMVCAVVLPVVSLHFYQVFPRPKPWYVSHRRRTLLTIYTLPSIFLVLLVGCYLHVRLMVKEQGTVAEMLAALRFLSAIIYTYLVVAALWYVGCVASLVYSLRNAHNVIERNQVKWILYGALVALLPIGYSLYLAIFDPDTFGAGGATWPMFSASVCLTAAFAVSITRYRLMELDKIITSGMVYFTISCLAGLAYYTVVFAGTLLFSQAISSPQLSQALTVSTTALVLMLVLDLARTRIKKALDRRFSRDKFQLDRTLQRMSQTVQQLVEPQALTQKLLQATSELLGVTRGVVFLREQPDLYRQAAYLGEAPALDELPIGCPLIESLTAGHVVLLTRASESSATPAQKQLRFLGGAVAQALIHEGRLVAFLILGARNSPYRYEELNVLSAFAQITVLALESADGHRMIEQLNRELKDKVDKISEQQRRIITLQGQLRRQAEPASASEATAAASEVSRPAGGILGNSPVVCQLMGLIRKVAATDAVVLIRGESGTGKELVAAALHESSARAGKPFVKVHCAALSANLLESELFGHVKGAFTGAHKDKVGRFELAHGGTLFLDEIGDVSLEVQTKLLRILQEKTFERVGSSDPVQVDVRILAATHQDLDKLIKLGRFREDLYYRLNVFPIRVPALRERVEDIPELAAHFLRVSAARCRKDMVEIEDDALQALKNYVWPGNIRQLENVIERAVVISESSTIDIEHLPAEVFATASVMDASLSGSGSGAARRQPTSRSDRAERERDEIVRALAIADGNKAEAARAMGMARSTLVSRLKKLGLS